MCTLAAACKGGMGNANFMSTASGVVFHTDNMSGGREQSVPQLCLCVCMCFWSMSLLVQAQGYGASRPNVAGCNCCKPEIRYHTNCLSISMCSMQFSPFLPS